MEAEQINYDQDSFQVWKKHMASPSMLAAGAAIMIQVLFQVLAKSSPEGKQVNRLASLHVNFQEWVGNAIVDHDLLPEIEEWLQQNAAWAKKRNLEIEEFYLLLQEPFVMSERPGASSLVISPKYSPLRPRFHKT